jgi:hypothetical protein
MRRTLMDTARKHHSTFFGVASSLTGARFDTVEVRSSSLLVPTIFSAIAAWILRIQPLFISSSVLDPSSIRLRRFTEPFQFFTCFLPRADSNR